MPSAKTLQRVLFHELVHTAQYRTLRISTFVEHYLSGWFTGGFDESTIPLERMAYGLEEQFAAQPGKPFPVNVRQSLREE